MDKNSNYILRRSDTYNVVFDRLITRYGVFGLPLPVIVYLLLYQLPELRSPWDTIVPLLVVVLVLAVICLIGDRTGKRCRREGSVLFEALKEGCCEFIEEPEKRSLWHRIFSRW